VPTSRHPSATELAFSTKNADFSAAAAPPEIIKPARIAQPAGDVR
jgi:hypothetical protein